MRAVFTPRWMPRCPLPAWVSFWTPSSPAPSFSTKRTARPHSGWWTRAFSAARSWPSPTCAPARARRFRRQTRPPLPKSVRVALIPTPSTWCSPRARRVFPRAWRPATARSLTTPSPCARPSALTVTRSLPTRRLCISMHPSRRSCPPSSLVQRRISCPRCSLCSPSSFAIISTSIASTPCVGWSRH